MEDELTGLTIMKNWKLWMAYLRCVYQLPLANTKFIISTFFTKMLDYLQYVTIEGAAVESDEEDLLFGMPQTPKEEKKQEVEESMLEQEFQSQMIDDVKELIGYLVMISDVAHVFLLSTQVQQHKCFPGELGKQIDMKLNNMMFELSKQRNVHPLGIVVCFI